MDEYRCVVCNMKFASKQELDGHMEREHKKSEEGERPETPVGEKKR